jgi:excisionase family DNA binding protein
MTASPIGEQLYTVDEVAAVIRKGRTYTWNLLRAGKMDSFMIGNRRLVTESALAEFIKRSQG